MKKFLFNNLSPKQTIFKNTFWLSLGTGMNKLLALGLVIYAARILGAEGYGEFTFALAFASLLMIFSDLGLSPVVTREFAREKDIQDEFYSVISLKVILAFGSFLFVLLAAFFFVAASQIQMIILVLALFLLMNSVIGIFYSFFHALQKMEYEALFEALQVVMLFGFGLFVLLQLPSAQNLSYAYFFSAAIVLVFVFVFFHTKVSPLRLRFDIAVWKKFLSMSWPLALIGMFGALYSYTDSVMLGYWNMLEETGWYNAAYRIVTASLVPMGLIGASFYPALSRFSKESKEMLQRVWNYELELMITLALPLVAGGIILAPSIISSFYPIGFTPSILAFQILIGMAGLIFLYRPLYDAMIALNQQKKTFWITVAGGVVNVALNFMLIPIYSLYGAAVATVATHLLVLLLIIVFVKKFTFLRFPILRIVLTLFASVVSVSLMYFVLQYAKEFNIFLVVGAGVAAYFGAFLLIRKYILLPSFKHVYA